MMIYKTIICEKCKSIHTERIGSIRRCICGQIIEIRG